MAEQLLKLSPDRDLQCYFYTPSAIAAMSNATPQGFTLSGTWRQQFDWAVVDWTRDNVFEHPALRYLPDGDLSGLTLSYRETRTNCIALESSLSQTTDWPSLRMWAVDASGVELLHYVSLKAYSQPVQGRYTSASTTVSLGGLARPGDRIGVAMPIATSDYAPDQHYFYKLGDNDTITTAVLGLSQDINAANQGFLAAASGPTLTLTWNGQGQTAGKTGADGNRISIYTYTSAGALAKWNQQTATLAGGIFPSTYEITIPFGSLGFLTNDIRKMRWTWAADLQPGNYNRSEFSVLVSNWTVTGPRRQYQVAGPGSRRIENDNPSVSYSPTTAWTQQGPGNYSGSNIHLCLSHGATLTIPYSEPSSHQLFLGTRKLAAGAAISVSVDGQVLTSFDCRLPGEDVLVRLPLGDFSPGSHSVIVTHAGEDGDSLYFDFLEIANPTADLPELPVSNQLTLATDWDTYHSQSLPAERTAWLLQKLGFRGRVNHYVGALWFYELSLPGHQYETAVFTVSISQADLFGSTKLWINGSPIEHANLPDDTAATIALALANLINLGATQVWASASGNQLTITARQITKKGASNSTSISVEATGGVTGVLSSSTLTNGNPGEPYTPASLDDQVFPFTNYWRTDLTANPVLNRAARDWSQAFYRALKSYGTDVVAAFSTEMMNADPGPEAGIAQCRFDGSPVVVNTPAIMTNFSPESLSYWKKVYLEMADCQAAAGMVPYLQSGEVQWWYYPWNQLGELVVSMPFYDAYTQQQFQTQFGVPMRKIVNKPPGANEGAEEPALYPNEVSFLPTLVGSFTRAIRTYLQAKYPACRYEVLYPTDTNDNPINTLVNFPDSDWTPQHLACLKTESFLYTGNRSLDDSVRSMRVSAAKGFPNAQRSHLIGIGDTTSSWLKETNYAQGEQLESVVLFALDQYCLIGYPVPPIVRNSSSGRQG